MPVLAPCIPLLPRGTVPLLLLLFLPWLPVLSCASLFSRALRVPCAPLCTSPAPPLSAITSCHAIDLFLTSYPLDSDRPVCTIPSAVSAVAVLSPLCAIRVFYPCPSLLSLPFSVVSCCILTLGTLFCFLPLACALPLFPDSLSFRDAMDLWRGGGVYFRTGLWPCSWTG